MTESTTPVVLAGIDGSNISHAVADYAGWIAARVDAPLKLLHNLERLETPMVADLTGSIGLGTRETLLEELTEVESRRSKIMLEQGKLMLEEARKRATAFDVQHTILCQRHGGLPETLVDMEEDIRVLVLGVRGEAHDNQQGLGNQLETVIRALHKPVLVVNRNFERPERIMLAYDDSEAAQKALNMLVTSPLYKGMTCHVVHVGKDDQQTDELLGRARQRLEQAGLDVRVAKLKGTPEEELIAYQEQHGIQMIVMGSFGHSRLREMLLGSFTLKMLEKVKIPLLLLR